MGRTVEKLDRSRVATNRFFIHQNTEKESPLLSEYFVKKINKTMNLDIPVPRGLSGGESPKLDL